MRHSCAFSSFLRHLSKGQVLGFADVQPSRGKNPSKTYSHVYVQYILIVQFNKGGIFTSAILHGKNRNRRKIDW